MLRIPAELQDVLLRDAHMLEEFPQRVLGIAGPLAANCQWYTFYGVAKARVCAAVLEQIEDMFANRFFLRHP